MARKANTSGKMNIHVADEDAAAMLRIVLAYESGVRGRTLGQACYEMVMEAANVDSYPPELRDHLNELAAKSSRIAVQNALRASAAGDD